MLEQKNRVDQNQSQTCMSSQGSRLTRQLLYSGESDTRQYCSNSFCPCKERGRTDILPYQFATSVIINPSASNGYTFETTQSECSDQFQSLDSVNVSSRQIDINQQSNVVQEEYEIKTVLSESQDHSSQYLKEVKNPETEHQRQTVTFLDNSFKKDNGKLHFIKNKIGEIKKNVTESEALLHQLQKDFNQFKLKFKADHQNLKEALSRYLEAERMQRVKMQSTVLLQKQEFDKILKRQISMEANKYFEKQVKMQLQIEILLQEILRVKRAGEQSIVAERDKLKVVNRELQQLKQRLMRNEMQNDVLRRLIKEKEREENNKNLTIKQLQFKISELTTQNHSPNKNQQLLDRYSSSRHSKLGESGVVSKQSLPQRQQIVLGQRGNKEVLNSRQLKQILRTFSAQVDGDQFFTKDNPEIKVALAKGRRALTQDNLRNSNNSIVKKHKFYEIVAVENTKNRSNNSNIFKERQRVINEFQNTQKIKVLAQAQTPINKDSSRALYYLKYFKNSSKMAQIEEQLIKFKSQFNPSIPVGNN